MSQQQYDRVWSYIRKGIEEGAEVLAGGEGHPQGLDADYFVKPTVFVSVKNEMTIAREAYCLAHHVTIDGSKRRLMVASLRYNDTFVKTDGAWLFSERLLYVDWVNQRVLS